MRQPIKTFLRYDGEDCRFFVHVPLAVIRLTKLKPNQDLYLEYKNGIMVFCLEPVTEDAIKLKLEQIGHSPDGYFISIPTLILAKLLYKPRQIFNITVSGKTISYDPYDKVFGYIGREGIDIFENNPKILKEYKSENRFSEFEIYSKLPMGPGRLEWMKGMNIY
jgi:hypothetical protein